MRTKLNIQNKWNDIVLFWYGEERNERIEEKSSAEPNYYIIAHMHHTTKKSGQDASNTAVEGFI
jgi:hypothetical protein